jgi:hypothetical protein
VSEVKTGKVGEIITLLRLTQMNKQAEIVHVAGSDILVVDGQRTWRVQVKASHLKRNKDRIGYQFCVSKGLNPKRSLTYEDCDIVALVAIEQERVLFVPVEYFNGIKTQRRKQIEFDQPYLESDTWDACMVWYKNNR